jgi:hypothetical protein
MIMARDMGMMRTTRYFERRARLTSTMVKSCPF